MNKTMKQVLLSGLAVSLFAGNAMAIPLNANNSTPGDTENGLQTIFNDFTNSGPSSVDVLTDYLADTGPGSDTYWDITASGVSSAQLIIEIAGYASVNTFGVYDTADKDNFLEIFDGTDAAGTKVALSIGEIGNPFHVTACNLTLSTCAAEADHKTFSSASFGYYMVSGSGDTWYSDTTLNTDNLDHLLAYQGTGDSINLPGSDGFWTDNEYVLAWEDSAGPCDANWTSGDPGSDCDFNDMVLMVESVRPVPEPASLLMLGASLLGLGFLGLKEQKKSALKTELV